MLGAGRFAMKQPCATPLEGQSVLHRLNEGRGAYLVPARGELLVNGQAISERAGVSIADENKIEIKAASDSEIVLVDAPYPWHPRGIARH